MSRFLIQARRLNRLPRCRHDSSLPGNQTSRDPVRFRACQRSVRIARANAAGSSSLNLKLRKARSSTVG